jgi:cysteine dioxygenase
MEGMDAYRPRSRTSSCDFLAAEDNVTSMTALVRSLDFIFSHFINWPVRKEKIEALLKKVSLTTDEANKYTFWDIEKAYTRNLVHTDGKHYTLLLLCWNPGRESSIHNHPCDGCFVKVTFPPPPPPLPQGA